MRTRRSLRNQAILWRELGGQGAAPGPNGYEWAPMLYDEVAKRGITHEHHYSDLYLPATEEVRMLLLHYGHHKRGDRSTPSPFRHQVEGGIWIDVPFAYAPYWRERAACPS